MCYVDVESIVLAVRAVGVLRVLFVCLVIATGNIYCIYIAICVTHDESPIGYGVLIMP